MASFLPQEVIRKKRDGIVLEEGEIATLIAGIGTHAVSEAQVAAFAMAVFFRGMSLDECVALTRAMRDSGKVLDWRALDIPGPLLDKHSTGGVGDTVSLMLGPMVAACGGYVPMISGRGLGHTGGTLDKLDAIPGYRSTPSTAEFQRVVREVGVAIIGQTGDLAPADAVMYATRDVTATVESIPLITASILSKKLAAGLQGLTMDVKIGSGAFMPFLADAQKLADSLRTVGGGAGLPVSVLLTDMNEPLAPCAGNAIELRCALDYLTVTSDAARSPRLHAVTMALAAEMLLQGGLAADADAAHRLLAQALQSGRAAQIFARMVAALGGPADLIERPDAYLKPAPEIGVLTAWRDGYVQRIATRNTGLAVVALGGGRSRAEDVIDPRVGLSGILPVGSAVRAGDVLVWIHAADTAGLEVARSAMRDAIVIGDAAPTLRPLIAQSRAAA